MKTDIVRLYVDGFELVGKLHYKKSGHRLTDLLNDMSERFLALTEVRMFDPHKNEVSQEDFICINKSKVLMVKPA